MSTPVMCYNDHHKLHKDSSMSVLQYWIVLYIIQVFLAPWLQVFDMYDACVHLLGPDMKPCRNWPFSFNTAKMSSVTSLIVEQPLQSTVFILLSVTLFFSESCLIKFHLSYSWSVPTDKMFSQSENLFVFLPPPYSVWCKVPNHHVSLLS